MNKALDRLATSFECTLRSTGEATTAVAAAASEKKTCEKSIVNSLEEFVRTFSIFLSYFLNLFIYLTGNSYFGAHVNRIESKGIQTAGEVPIIKVKSIAFCVLFQELLSFKKEIFADAVECGFS